MHADAMLGMKILQETTEKSCKRGASTGSCAIGCFEEAVQSAQGRDLISPLSIDLAISPQVSFIRERGSWHCDCGFELGTSRAGIRQSRSIGSQSRLTSEQRKSSSGASRGVPSGSSSQKGAESPWNQRRASSNQGRISRSCLDVGLIPPLRNSRRLGVAMLLVKPDGTLRPPLGQSQPQVSQDRP